MLACISVARYINSRRLTIRFDYTVSVEGQSLHPTTPGEVKKALAVDRVDLAGLLDELLSADLSFKRVVIRAAFRIYAKKRVERREKRIWLKVMNADQCHDKEAADNEWKKLSRLFVSTGRLPEAVFQSFIWNCKQKALGRSPNWHLMPVIFGKQGSGKTIFARAFPSPLGELVADGVLFTDLADPRSGDIFRFPVVICDDLEKIAPSQQPRAKAVLTGKTIHRRPPGTQKTMPIEQRCSPIGTSNRPLEELFPDETGNRRFVTLEFRNGNVVTGGDPDVWPLVNAIDYLLLWRSIDPLGPNPLAPFLHDLSAYQKQFVPRPALLSWLQTLDLNSDELCAARVRGGYASDKLRTLFVAQTGENMSQFRFANEMPRYFAREGCPFCDWGRNAEGAFYIAKPPDLKDPQEG